MRRTQLYLEDDLWTALKSRARAEKTTISELARQAIRDRYLGKLDERRKAMQSVVGLWRDREDIGDSEQFVRELRRGNRLERVTK